MGVLEQGETYTEAFRFTNAAGVLVDPGTVTASVTLPDGTTASPTPTATAPGVYSVSYTTEQVGRHAVVVTGTGGDLGVDVVKFTSVCHAEPPGQTIVSPGAALRHLRATGTITADADIDHLRWLCVVATDAIQLDLGRTYVRADQVDILDGGRTVLSLLKYPVLSVTSVVEDGSTLTEGDDFIANLRLGHLRRGTSSFPRRWNSGYQNVTVTYVVGETSTPPIVRKVALNGIEKMWQKSQQAIHPEIEPFVGNFVTVAAGTLTPLELGAYNRLRTVGLG